MSIARFVVAGLLAAAVLGGCAGTRPIVTIRENGDDLMKRGDYAAAAVEYQEIVDRYPGDWRGQYKLGLCLIQLDRLAEARRALEVAHTRRPGDLDVADALAETIYRQGDDAHLFTFLRERADRLGTVHAYLRLAEYGLRMSDPDSALVAAETAIEIDDGLSVEPYLVAADVAERVGDVETAVRRLRQEYGIDPEDERISERLRKHGQIPGPTIVLAPGR